MSIDSPAGAPTHATFKYMGVLPDADYRATVLAMGLMDASFNQATQDTSQDFFVLAGDANHDGVIDGDDYAMIDAGFNLGKTGFSHGDFNYDGVIDGDDYAIIDAAFNAQ
jgi:hypothetical protein